MEKQLETRVVCPDGVVSSTIINKRPSRVHWLSISVKRLGTRTNIYIYDGFDRNGDLKWELEPGYSRHHNFIPSFVCRQGIFVYTTDGISSYTIGYCVEPWKNADAEHIHV